MTIGLKPCPAGHKAHIWRNSHGFRPVCNDQLCEWAVGDYDSESAAAEAWNTRAEPKVLDERFMCISPDGALAYHTFDEEYWANRDRDEWTPGWAIVRVKIVEA